MIKTLFFFALVAAAMVSAQNIDIEAFDLFTVQTDIILVVTDASLPFPQVASGSTTDSAIVGGARDLAVAVESGDNNQVLTAGVSGGLFSVSTPSDGSGLVLMQYDGVDNVLTFDGPTPNGLGAFDATLNGAALGLHFIISSDQDTTYTFTFYDANNQESATTITIPGNAGVFEDYNIAYSDLLGSANLASLGAFEIEIEAFQNVDTNVEGFFFFGPAASIAPSVPVVPTPEPQPSPNGFTWYTFDDDDNGRSPCGDEPDRRSYFLSDNNIVYYYFFGFDFTTQEASSSDAATLAASAAGVAAGVAAVLL